MGLAHSPKIATANLALLLDPANTKSYPGSGTTWFDLSGNSNNATLTNAPTFANNIVTWNGSSQYATITSNETSLSFQTEQTVMIWMKRTQAGSPLNRENPWDQAYGGYGTWTHEPSGSINMYYGTSGANAVPYQSDGSGSFSFDNWYCHCFTRNTSSTVWYRNGIQINTQANWITTGSPPGSAGTSAANIRVARGYAGYWEGEMGPVLAYTRALTSSEVEQNFNAHRGRFGI